MMEDQNFNAQTVIDEFYDGASVGSISEIDELDTSFLFNGEHTHQFEAIYNLQVQYRDTISNIEKTQKIIKQKKSYWAAVKDFFMCRHKNKRDNIIQQLQYQLQKMNAFVGIFQKSDSAHSKEFKIEALRNLKDDTFFTAKMVMNPKTQKGHDQ